MFFPEDVDVAWKKMQKRTDFIEQRQQGIDVCSSRHYPGSQRLLK